MTTTRERWLLPRPLTGSPGMPLLWVTVAVSLLVILGKPTSLSWLHAILGGAIVWLGVLPTVAFPGTRDCSVHPVFPVSCLFYAICFGLPVFFADFIWADSASPRYHLEIFDTTGDALSVSALSLIAAGLAFYVTAFVLARRRLGHRLPRIRLPRTMTRPQLVWLLWGLLLIHLAYHMAPALQGLPSLGQFAVPAGYLAMGGFLYLSFKNEIGRGHTVAVFCVAAPVLFVIVFSKGLITPILFYSIMVFFVCLKYKKRFLLLIFVFCGAIFFVYNITSTYRALIWPDTAAWSAQAERRPLSDFALILKVILGATRGERVVEHGDRSIALSFHPHQFGYVRPLVRRLSLTPLLSLVVAKTPEEVPHWHGSTYAPLLTSFIPRAVWHNKPEERLEGEFGREYGLVLPNEATSINVPWIVELYANFGTMGVLAGMALIGLFLAALDSVLNARRMTPIEGITGLAVLFPLVYQESNLSLMCGSLLPLTLSLLIYFYFGTWALDKFDKGLRQARSRISGSLSPRPGSGNPGHGPSRYHAWPWLSASSLTGRVILSLASVALLATIAAPYAASPRHAALGAAIIWVGVLPAVLFHRFRDISRLPVFPVSCLFYAICFGLPVFLVPILWPEGRPFMFYAATVSSREMGISIESLVLILVGLILYVGAFFLLRRPLSRALPRLRLPPTEGNMPTLILVWGLLALHLAYISLPQLRTLPSVGQFAIPAGYLAVGMFLFLALNGRLPKAHAFAVFGAAIPLLWLMVLSGGHLTPLMWYGIVGFFVLWLTHRRYAVAACVVGAAFAAISYGFLDVYRSYVWAYDSANKEYVESSFLKKSALFIDLALYHTTGQHAIWTKQELERLDRRFRHQSKWRPIVHRLSLSPLMSHVVDETPENVPFLRGTTYAPLVTSFVPRALWSNKPEERLGSDFGVRYGLTVGEPTSLNVPWIVETYANFGILGVVIGMTAIGAFLAFLDRLFNTPDMSPLEMITGLAILFPLVFQESNFSLMCGSILPLTLCLLIYFHLGLRILPALGGLFGLRSV